MNFTLLILFLNLTTITTILGSDYTDIVTAQIAAVNSNFEEFEKQMFELDKNLRLNYFTDPNSKIPVYRIINDIVATLPELKKNVTLVAHLAQQKETLFGRAIATIAATDARDHFDNVTIQSLPTVCDPYKRPTPSEFDKLPDAIRRQVMTYARAKIISTGDSLPFYLCTKAVQNTHDEEYPSKIRTCLLYKELTPPEQKDIDDAIEQKNRK